MGFLITGCAVREHPDQFVQTLGLTPAGQTEESLDYMARMLKRNSVQFVLAIGLVGLAISSSPVIAGAEEGAAPSPGIAPPVSRANLAPVLNFELPRTDAPPQGWNGTPPSTVFSDTSDVHSGHGSVRIERHPGSPATFSSVTTFIPIDFLGQTVELRGFLRTRDVRGFAGLWAREDGSLLKSLAFQNMQDKHLNGTTEWTEYSIKLPLHPEARSLFFGALLDGTGTAWADDLQLLVDGKPVWEVPHVDIPKTPFEADREFDSGSGIQLDSLTPNQVEFLFTLGKVWGFLKYHHSAIASGQRNWDYDLFRVLPKVLAARDHEDAMAAIAHWVAQLGAVAACAPCATLNGDELHLQPDLNWIDNQRYLGSDLSQALQKSYAARPADGKQFYVSRAPEGNPKFEHELSYPAMKTADPGIQLLGLFRFWNIIEYWFPYRNLIDDWDSVLRDSIPRIALAKNFDDYQLQLMRVIAAVQDSHDNLSSSLKLRPPVGECQLPVILRYVEKRFVVSDFASNDGSSGLKIGDAITAIEGQLVNKQVFQVSPYYGDSNEAARSRDIGRALTRGACGSVPIEISRDTNIIKLAVDRVETHKLDLTRDGRHDLPGDTFQILPQNIVYLKLSSVKTGRVNEYLDAAANSKGLIVDIRNYPSEFVVFALGSHFVQKDTHFARFTEAELSNPGVFRWRQGQPLTPEAPLYAGKLVILVDETSQSQSEYTAMALRATPHAIVMGSTTAGADGDISAVSLPGNLLTYISGLGVFYPDKRPTQRIGIVPDIIVRPTVAGIRAGRDEVLQAAIDYILGEHAQHAVKPRRSH
jgi:C-terminal processing protease CtpA/Prc